MRIENTKIMLKVMSFTRLCSVFIADLGLCKDVFVYFVLHI